MNSFNRFEIEKMVSNQIDSSAKDACMEVLNDSNVMNSILKINTQELEERVRSIAQEEMDKVANADNYHEMTDTYLAKINERVEKDLVLLNDKYHKAFGILPKFFQVTGILKKRIECLENKLNYMTMGLAGLSVLTGFLTYFSLSRS